MDWTHARNYRQRYRVLCRYRHYAARARLPLRLPLLTRIPRTDGLDWPDMGRISPSGYVGALSRHIVSSSFDVANIPVL